MNLLDIKDILEKEIFVPIQIGSLVDGNCIGLISTSGFPPTFFFNGMVTNEGLQIISRHESYLEGETNINKAFALLDNLDILRAEQTPFFIGRNDKEQAEFSVNFIIMNTR